MRIASAPPFGWFASGSALDLLGRLRLSYRGFGALAAFFDALAVVTASVTSGAVYHLLVFGHIGNVVEFFGFGLIAACLTAALMQMRGLYSPDSLVAVHSRFGSIVLIWICVFLFLLAISFTLKISDDLSRGSVLALACLAPCLILLERRSLRSVVHFVLRKRWLKRRKVLVITQNPDGAPSNPELLHAYEFVDCRLLRRTDREARSEFQSIVNALRGSTSVDEVHLEIDWNCWAQIKSAVSELRALPLPVRLIADPTAREILQYPHESAGAAFSFELQRSPLRPIERAAKRAFDLAIASLGLFVLAPFLLLVAFTVKLDSPGPALFKQARGGFNGRAFTVFKFRTMRVMEDGVKVTQAQRDDRRTTRVGRWLRQSSVDELPQLINVLRGDMSLVGPRPHALAHDHQYSQVISRYPFRHHVKPGITGWAQVNGYRGETPTIESMDARVQLDFWYVRNWSFWLDIRILFWTAIEVLRSRNAF